MPRYKPRIIPILKSLLFEDKMEFKKWNERVLLQKLQKTPLQRFHSFIGEISVSYHCLLCARHYSRHWVLSSEQQREPAQGLVSGSQHFGVSHYSFRDFMQYQQCLKHCLAFNLQSEDYIKDFRQNILLLKTMKKSQMKRKKFHIMFLVPGDQEDWFLFLSQLIELTSYFVVKTTL